MLQPARPVRARVVVESRNVQVRAVDGATVQARLFTPRQPPRQALLFLPAMGAAPPVYDAFARELARTGVGVLVGDHRGGRSSSLTPSRGVDFDYAQMLERDWPALEAATREAFPHARVHVGGHSLGGQLAALYAGGGGAPDGHVVLVASGSVHFRGYPGARRWKVLGASAVIAATAATLGHYPGHRMGFGGHQARGVMLDWARECRRGRYSSRGGAVDLEPRLRQVDRRLLAVDVMGDGMAPRGAVGTLLSRMPRAEVVRLAICAPARPRRLDPHFRWLKDPADAVREVARFLAC